MAAWRSRAEGFRARFQGWCDNCDHRIEVDELIVGVGTGKFVHTTCPEDVQEKPTKFQGTTLESMGF